MLTLSTFQQSTVCYDEHTVIWFIRFHLHVELKQTDPQNNTILDQTNEVWDMFVQVPVDTETQNLFDVKIPISFTIRKSKWGCCMVFKTIHLISHVPQEKRRQSEFHVWQLVETFSFSHRFVQSVDAIRTVCTPSTAPIKFLISDITIGWLICHLSILK